MEVVHLARVEAFINRKVGALIDWCISDQRESIRCSQCWRVHPVFCSTQLALQTHNSHHRVELRLLNQTDTLYHVNAVYLRALSLVYVYLIGSTAINQRIQLILVFKCPDDASVTH